MNIFTEREFTQKIELEVGTVNDWIEEGIIRPIETFGRRFIYLRKHISLAEKIKQLLNNGMNIQEIAPFVENEDIDLENVLNSSQLEEMRNLAYYQNLHYDELVEACQSEGVIGFRRMTREEMEISLAEPDRREEMSERVRERNRQQQATVQQTEPVVVNEEVESISNLTYSELTNMANGRVPNFRRMTKDELIIALSGTEEEVNALIESVRDRTRRRYGSGRVTTEETTTHNEPTIRVDEVVEPVEEVVTQTEEVTEVEEVIEPVEEVVTETREFIEVEEVEETETTVVPYSLEELEAMNSKQVAVVVRDYLPDVKYFRRMTKAELITCIFHPDRREEMMSNAYQRYQRYNRRG